MKFNATGPPDQPTAGARQKDTPFRLATARSLLLLAAFLMALAIGEVALRLFFKETFASVEDEKNLTYRYDAQLGWFPIPNSKKSYTGARTILVSHNSEGFRGPEFARHGPMNIVFLGDSFVWGVDAEVQERFTERLQARHPEWTVYNLGVSGYGTDQEYLLLQKYFDRFKPRVVFLMYCAENDDSDNCWNVRNGYYKPYGLMEGTRLKLAGIPVPRSERVFCSEHPRLAASFLVRLFVKAYYRLKNPAPVHNANPTGPILRDLHKYVELRGATLVVGLTRSHPHLEEFLRFFKIPYLDLSNPLRYSTFGEHWTPEGHVLVAQRIEAFLQEGKFLEPVSSATNQAQNRAPLSPDTVPVR